MCRKYKVLLLDDLEIIERACEIHADLKSTGMPIQDANVLIAATAITRGLVMVSLSFRFAESTGYYYIKLVEKSILMGRMTIILHKLMTPRVTDKQMNLPK